MTFYHQIVWLAFSSIEKAEYKPYCILQIGINSVLDHMPCCPYSTCYPILPSVSLHVISSCFYNLLQKKHSVLSFLPQVTHLTVKNGAKTKYEHLAGAISDRYRRFLWHYSMPTSVFSGSANQNHRKTGQSANCITAQTLIWLVLIPTWMTFAAAVQQGWRQLSCLSSGVSQVDVWSERERVAMTSPVSGSKWCHRRCRQFALICVR